MTDREQLRRRWSATLRDAGAPMPGDDAFANLYTAYTSPDRHYHNLEHIVQCLHELDAARPLAADPAGLELAVFFHDVVYDATRADNEQQSAEEAIRWLSALGVAESRCELVYGLILATRHDRPPTATDARLIVDIDLTSLAVPWDDFLENTRRIRLEYAHIDDATFRAGRRAFLGRMLERPTLYQTAHFRQRCEAPARANLQKAVQFLADAPA